MARGDVLADHEPAAARAALESAADLAAETGARLYERRAEAALAELPAAEE